MDRHAQHHPRSRACVLPNGLRLHTVSYTHL